MAAREVVVITGASAGVGRATVRGFAKRGAHIGLLARGREGLEGARREVEAAGGRALVLRTDVADAEQVEAAAEAVEREFGAIDVWVNNAMVSVFSPIAEMTAAEYRRVTEVTYLGAVHGTMSALERMRSRDRGCIVQVGSDSLRCELIHDGSKVRVTMVQLPALNTPQFDWTKSRLPRKAQPVPPIFQPEVAAEAIYWAAHNNRREVNVGLPTAAAIASNKIMPGLLDRYLGNTGYDGQQTEEADDPSKPNDLFEPLPRDHGAHGRFDDRAFGWSPQFWISRNRGALAIAAGVLALGSALLSNRKRL